MPFALPQGHEPDSVLARWQGRAITVREFLQHVELLARDLPDAAAAVNLCDDRYLFMVVFVALLRRGQINVLPPNRAPRVVAEAAADYHDCYYLAEQPLPGLELAFHRVFLPELTEAHGYAALQVSPGQTVAVLYTSGSTGRPRPNPKTMHELIAGNASIRQGLGLQSFAGATIVATVPPQHMFGLESTILLPLLGGLTVHAERPFFPEDLRHTLASVPEPRLLVTTPLHLRACIRADMDWPVVSQVISATAPLARTLAQEAEHLFGCQVREIYGSTETGAVAMRHTAADDAWQVLPGVRVIADNEGGASVQAQFLAHPIQLNDAVKLLGEGRFCLHGRHADMINIAGKRASLGDLTHKLLQIGGVEDAVIFQPERTELGVGRLCALVVAPSLDTAELQRELLQRFDPVFIPRPLYRVECLPRNEAGKLQHHDLLTLWLQLRGAHGAD